MSKDVGVGLARDCVQVSDQARGQGTPTRMAGKVGIVIQGNNFEKNKRCF